MIASNKKSINKPKVLFAVQGEGRGHLTQAIVAFELLQAGGFNICGIIVGGKKSQHLPDYFRKRIQSPIYRIQSPGFVRDDNNKAIRILPTIFLAIKKIGRYRKSIEVIREIIKRQKPDIIINFYEPLIGIAHLLNYIKVKTVSIAHQYLFIHPSFVFPEDLSRAERLMLKLYTRITSTGSDLLLALSFNNIDLKRHQNIIPCPPLLRNEVKTASPFKGEHLLVYIVNAGYMEDIISWHIKNPNITVHCFTDSKKVKEKWEYNEMLTFHSLNDQQFLRYMINAAAVVTSAGFESVCEAFYLGKPLMMVPVEGHAEQRCNAYDGVRAKAGIASDKFNLTKVMEVKHALKQHVEAFRDWTNLFPEYLYAAIHEVLDKKNIIQVDQDSTSEQHIPAYSIE